MHWLVRKSIESFLRETYSDDFWLTVCRSSGMSSRSSYIIDRHSQELITTASDRLEKPECELLEDLGAWIARQERIRRLLRFSGRDFNDFLLNLEMLADRVSMVAPDLSVPRMQVTEEGADVVRVDFPPDESGWVSMMAGLVRCMADDYGALCLIWADENSLTVQISDGSFTPGRHFLLGEDAAT